MEQFYFGAWRESLDSGDEVQGRRNEVGLSSLECHEILVLRKQSSSALLDNWPVVRKPEVRKAGDALWWLWGAT